MNVTLRPSLLKFFQTTGDRIQANRAAMLGLMAVVIGSLASMTVMNRGAVTPLIAVPAIPVLVVLGLLPTLIYAATVRLIVTGNQTLERRTPWSRYRVETPRFDLVRYRVVYSPSFAGKKFYFGLDAQGRCQFTLQASLWRESDLNRLANSFGGQVRGAWTNTIEVDRVSATFGGSCQRW